MKGELEQANARIAEIAEQLDSVTRSRDLYKQSEKVCTEEYRKLQDRLADYDEMDKQNDEFWANSKKYEARIVALEARLVEAAAAIEANAMLYMREHTKAEADAARLRAALEAVEWLWIGQQDQNHPTDLICPWCKQRQGHPWCKEIPTQGHAPDCARQAALRAEQPAESEGKNV